LIAEDETLIRLDLRGLLEDRGFLVCAEARDGLEAVALARETEPDVAVLDMKMPRLDGIEAARRIIAERPVPIVMLTAHSDRGLVERAVSAGVFTYLVKPFREADLVPVLRAAAARHAELLGARRAVGGSARSFAIDLPSESGEPWPLQVTYLPDGTIDVSVRAVAP
jgi:response regulator NasT